MRGVTLMSFSELNAGTVSNTPRPFTSKTSKPSAISTPLSMTFTTSSCTSGACTRAELWVWAFADETGDALRRAPTAQASNVGSITPPLPPRDVLSVASLRAMWATVNAGLRIGMEDGQSITEFAAQARPASPDRAT